MDEPNPRPGVTPEDAYFRQQEKERLERQRAQLDDQRRLQKARELKQAHWMRCPKCGHEMTEITLSGIKVDQCTHCAGLYFDKGELAMLVDQLKPDTVLDQIKKLFGG